MVLLWGPDPELFITSGVTRSYQGHHNEKSMGGVEGTWERIMNVALERMVQQSVVIISRLKP